MDQTYPGSSSSRSSAVYNTSFDMGGIMKSGMAISARRAANLMFQQGLEIEQAQKGIDTIRQPAKNLFYITDVYSYIERVTK